MSALISHYGLLIVVLVIFTGEIGLPTLIPGEIAILLAGMQVVHSVPALVGTWLLFGIVDIIACNTIHIASRTCGNRLLLRLLRLLQPKEQKHEAVIEGWRCRLGGRDPLVVFVTRLIPMFRLYASITTGLIRIRYRDFVAGVIPASLLWAGYPLILGYTLRSKAAALQGEYPTMIHIVIMATAVILAGGVIATWVHGAGSHRAGVRRLRLVFGLATVGGALTRLVLVAMNVDHVFTRSFVIPSAQALSIWVAVLSLVALALMWVAAHDLRQIRMPHHHVRRIGMLSATAWLGLMLMFGALNTVEVVPLAAILH